MSRKAGPFLASQTVSVDSAYFTDIYAFYNSKYAEYATALTAYNALRTTFNEAYDKEDARRTNVVDFAFVNPFPVPVRPCPPT